MKEATIVKRKRHHDGTLVGTSNSNPLLDSRFYEIDFGDGNYFEYSANIIMENLYAQIDDDGRSSSLLQTIVDHRADNTAIPKSQGWYKSPTAHTKKRVITTKGWFLQVEWFDGTRTWVPLREFKETNSLEVAEYA